MFLPVCINITSQKILIVGGGKAALHKANSLLKYTQDITLVAPYLSTEVEALPIQKIHRYFEWEDLEDCFLVYAATDDRELNRAIGEKAQQKGILVNVCDDPSLSTFVSPAIHKEGDMSIAVSSNGTDVKASVALRNKIREELHDKSTG